MGEPIRLQKILASAGFGSRRGCETFITEGRVSVDGAVVSELGAKADIESQNVELDGRKIAGPGKLSKSMRDADERVYYALNKPKGALCTNDDPAGRPVAVQMIPEKRRIFCVGRLDLDTEGLILLTNDGDLTNRLTHPRYGVPKTYLARVEGDVGSIQMRKLQTGMHLAEGRTQGAKVRIRRKEGRHCVLEITISEGMNRQVRRMLARVELKCRSLKRIAIGPIKLGELDAGEFRKLTTDELDRLNLAISDAEAAGRAPRAEAPERAGKPERAERKNRDERSEPKRDRADRNAFAENARGNDRENEEEDEEFDDEDEESFAAASALAKHSKDSAPAAKRRVIDSDEDDESDEDDTELEIADDDSDLAKFESEDEEDEPEIKMTGKKIKADSATEFASADDEEDDDTEEEGDATEAEHDERSTQEAVDAMDEARPWEKLKLKTGKAWADRGDTVHDPELVAAGAEAEREAARILKERTAEQSDDARGIRDRGERTYPSDKRLRAGERKPRENRDDRARPASDRGESRGAPFGGKPWEKRPGAGRGGKPEKFADGERRPREYGERKGHTPRPWEKTREGGSDRPRTFSKPGGYERGGSSDRPRSYSKPGGFDKAGGSDRPRSYSKPGGYDRAGGSDRPRSFSKPGGYDRAGGSDRPRSYSKPGGFDKGGGSDRPRSYSKPGGYDKSGGSDRPRSYSKPGGYDRSGGSDRPRSYSKPGGSDRAGGSDRPRSYSKPGGYDRAGGSDRPRSYSKPGGFSKPGGYPRAGGDDRRPDRGDRPRENRDRGGRSDAPSASRSRPWENARPSNGEPRGDRGTSTRPWEKKREE